MKIKVALEWFLNPDHIPLIIANNKGWFRDAGLEVEIIEPKEHYDGFKALREGEIDLAINEPLHLIEQHFDDMLSLGCFFETKGGVMLKKEAITSMLNGEKIKITTPVSNSITNSIGFEILNRYCQKREFGLKRENVEFCETDFYHIKNLKDGFDGAWLCFDNFEGEEAKSENLDVLLIDSNLAKYPNFSALEFYGRKSGYSSNKESFDKFLEIVSKAVTYTKDNLDEAKNLYYEYSKESKSELMDSIIESTSGYLIENIVSDSKKWSDLHKFLVDLKVSNLSEADYRASFLDRD